MGKSAAITGSRRIPRLFGLEMAVFVFFLALYGITGRGHLTSDAAGAIASVTESLVETGSLALSSRAVESLSGYSGQDTGQPRYSMSGIGQSLALVPFYLVGRTAAAVVPGIRADLVIQGVESWYGPLTSALACLLLFLLGRQVGYSPQVAFAVTATYGLATMAFPYAKLPFEHPLETVLVLASVTALHRYLAGGGPLWLAAGWLLVGFGAITRLNVLVVVPLLAGYLLVSRWTGREGAGRGVRTWLRDVAVGALLLAPFLLWLAWYDTLRYGKVGSYNATDVPALFGVPIQVGLWGMLLSPGKGILWYCPPVLLGLVGWPRLYRRDRAVALLCLGIPGAYVLAFAGYRWWDVPDWGVRFLLATLPFLILPAGELYEGWRGQRRLATVGMVAVLTLGLAVQLSALVISPNRYYFDVEARRAAGATVDLVNSLPDSAVVRQWGSAAEALRAYAEPAHRANMTFHVGTFYSGMAWAEMRDRWFAVAAPDFWWIWYYHAGLPLGLNLLGLTGFLALLVAAAWRLAHLLEPGRPSPAGDDAGASPP